MTKAENHLKKWIQKNGFENIPIGEIMQSFADQESDYWKTRCKLSEEIEAENPCDPDITIDQMKAWENYNNFIKAKGKRS